MQQDTQAATGARPLLIAIAHQKGGSGKTTTTCNLAVGLDARLGPGRVAVLDLDPQGSATHHLGVGGEAGPLGLPGGFEVLSGRRTLREVLRPTNAGGVLLVPAGPRMTLAEVDPALANLSHTRLRSLLTGPDSGIEPDQLSCVLVDCAPGFGVFTTVMLMAADIIVVPTPLLPFAEAALDNTLEYIGRLRADGTRRVAILPTMVQGSDPLQADAAVRLRGTWPGNVFATTVPYDPVAEQAVAAGQPVGLYAPGSAIARAYDTAAGEVQVLIDPTAPPPARESRTPPPLPPQTARSAETPAEMEQTPAAPMDQEPAESPRPAAPPLTADLPPAWTAHDDGEDPPRKRRGCGCLMSILLVVLFLILVIAALSADLIHQGHLDLEHLPASLRSLLPPDLADQLLRYLAFLGEERP